MWLTFAWPHLSPSFERSNPHVSDVGPPLARPATRVRLIVPAGTRGGHEMAKVETEMLGPVMVLRINRPEVHNCVDGETADGIATAVDAFTVADVARVLVVTGAGDRAFCSRADLKTPGAL